MGIGWALGTGFVNAAVKQQEEVRDERRENRKLAMEVFLKDTMPRIRAARAKDDEAVSRMNTLMADSFYKGNPGLAFYSTKWQSQTGKDESAFREHIASNEIPQEIRDAQLAEMGKHFNYDQSTNAFSWKSQVPAIPAAQPQGGSKPSFWSSLGLSSKPDEGRDMQAGTNAMAKVAGVDPNAATSPRFDSINMPGSFKTVDPRAEKRAETTFAAYLRDPEGIKNMQATLNAYMSGGAEEAVKTLSYMPLEVRKDKEFNEGVKKAIVQGILSNISDMKDPTGALSALASGNLTVEKLGGILGKGMRTPEERAQLTTELKGRYEMPNGQLDWIALFADTDRFKEIFPDDATRKNVQASVMNAINVMQMTTNQKTLGGLGQAQIPPIEVVSKESPATGAPTAELGALKPADNVQSSATKEPPPPPKKTKEEITQDAMYEDDGLILKDIPAADVAPPKKDIPRAGTVTQFGTDEDIRNFPDPVRLLKDVQTRSKSKLKLEENKARAAVVAKNITVTPATFIRINEDEDYGKEWNDLMTQFVEPYLQEFGSLTDAQAAVHPFGLAKVRGRVVVVPPRRQ